MRCRTDLSFAPVGWLSAHRQPSRTGLMVSPVSVAADWLPGDRLMSAPVAAGCDG